MKTLKLVLLGLLTISIVNGENIEIKHTEKAHCFGDLAAHYEKGRTKSSNESFELAAKYVNRDEAVLDVGCGTGISTIPLMEKFDNVRGCDWDEKMLKYAQEKAPGHFDQASVYSLPYPQNQFGLVTAFASYHWFCDDAATQQISRILKPGGYFLVCSLRGKSGMGGVVGEADQIIEEVLKGVGIKPTAPRENYEPLGTLKRNGFEIVETKEVFKTTTYTIDEALEYMQSRSLWAYVVKAHKEQETLEKLKTFFESSKDKEGKIAKTAVTTLIMARKSP